MSKKKLIPRCLYGTNRGGLVHHDRITPGTWGNRGYGNELESALEKGLSSIGKGAMWLLQLPDHIQDGTNWLLGAIPGGPTSELLVHNGRAKREAGSGGLWKDYQGNAHVNPTYAVLPDWLLPSPAGKAKAVVKYDDLLDMTPAVKKASDVTNKTTKIKITAENAAKITDSLWDEAYNAAIANNDLAEVQRLRDLHFKVKAPNTKVVNEVYRGWHDVPQNTLNTDVRFSPWGNVTAGSWFGTDGDFIRQVSDNNPERLKHYYLNLQNPFIKDANGRRWNELLPFDMTEDDLIREMKSMEKNFPDYVVRDWEKNLTSTTDHYATKIHNGNYDGGIITNIREGNTSNPMDDYIITKSTQAKLSDPITYADDNSIIPLSKRDNFSNPDVRYSWLLPIGLTTTFGFSYLNLNDLK